jgi:hypothetical protein
MKYTPEEIVGMIRTASITDAIELLELYGESCSQDGEKKGLEFAMELYGVKQ